MRSMPLLTALFSVAASLLLPEPNGSYHVAVQVQSLTDNGRMDPYAPPSAPHKRKVLISMFWPFNSQRSCPTQKTPYMPPETAKVYGLQAAALGLSNETFADFEMKFCNMAAVNLCNRASKRSQYPLVLLSPGAGNSRLLYSGMAKSLASRGYVVVTVDHPYDASIVEFPDGSVIFEADIPENTTNLEFATRVRSQDLSFVLSQLKDPRIGTAMTGKLPGRINFSQVVAYGHSLGGASAAEAILSNNRFRGGADLDGQIFNSVLSQGLSKPFLLFGRPDHREEDSSWVRFWDNLRGPKMELELNDSLHGSFTDLPLLLHSLNLPEQYQSGIEAVVGKIDGVELVTEAVSRFFTLVLNGSASSLLDLIDESSGLTLVGKERV